MKRPRLPDVGGAVSARWDLLPRWAKWLVGLLAFALTMALGGAAEMMGKAAGFFAAYLVFLLIGFAVNRIVLSRSRAAAVIG